MKKQLHPAVAITVIVLAFLGVGFFLYLKTGGFGPQEVTPQQNPMPAGVGEDMAKIAAEANAMMKQRGMENKNKMPIPKMSGGKSEDKSEDKADKP